MQCGAGSYAAQTLGIVNASSWRRQKRAQTQNSNGMPEEGSLAIQEDHMNATWGSSRDLHDGCVSAQSQDTIARLEVRGRDVAVKHHRLRPNWTTGLEGSLGFSMSSRDKGFGRGARFRCRMRQLVIVESHNDQSDGVFRSKGLEYQGSRAEHGDL